MDYATAISQFQMLIEDIDKAKLDPMNAVSGYVGEALVGRCQVLINHYYKTNEEYDPSPFWRDFINIKKNFNLYNFASQITQLRILCESMLLDLKLRRQDADKEVDRTKQTIRKLEKEVERLEKEIEKGKGEEKTMRSIIDDLHSEIKAQTNEIKQLRIKKASEDINRVDLNLVKLAKVSDLLMRKLNRTIAISSLIIISLINAAIPFVLQKFNWIATGTAQAITLIVFLFRIYKLKLSVKENVKQHIITAVIAIISTVISGFILFKLGWTK